MKDSRKALIKRASIFGMTGLVGMLLFLYVQSGGNRFGQTLFFVIFYYSIPTIIVTIGLSLLIHRYRNTRKFFGSRANLVLNIAVIITVFVYPWGRKLSNDFVFHLITVMFLWLALTLVFSVKTARNIELC